MSAAIFQDLCNGFCGIAGVSAPQLVMEPDGLLAFHVTLQGVTVDFVYAPDAAPGHLAVLVDCGPLAGHDADAMSALLDANFFRLHTHLPVFSRNPATGDAALQLILPIEGTTPAALFEAVTGGIETALQWREGRGAGARQTHEPQLAPGALA